MVTPIPPSAPPPQPRPSFGEGPTGAPGASAEAIRRAQEVSRWRRRSLFIRFWRGFLPVLIAAVVIGLVGWVALRSFQGGAPAAGGDIRMVHPRFYGRNAKNQPYTLTADQAVRDNHNTQLTALVQPRLSMHTEAPAPVTAQSDRGLLNQDTHLLQMNGSVKVDDGHGYTYLSDSALIDTMTHDASGDSHVTGDGPMGHFEGDSYRIDQKNGHAVLTGHVHTHLLPAASTPAPISTKAQATPTTKP